MSHMPELTDTPASTDAADGTDEARRTYEICILYPLALSQKEEQAVLEEIEETIEETGARQIAKDAWNRRGLAFPIRGNTEGKFVIYYYEITTDKLREIDEALRIIPNLLRHMIVKPPNGYHIEKYSEKYEEWLKNREKEDERQEREHEEELKKRVVERAKRKVKKVAEEKEKISAAKETAKADEAELSEQLEKLISDDLDI